MAVAIDASQILAKAKFLPHTVDKDDDLQYDLGNLTAIDVHPLNPADYEEDSEAIIKNTARDNAQLLFNRIFALPTEKTETGILAVLPAITTKIPREKPIPRAKVPTRWELFRQTKGIEKRKKERLVWDDTTNEWKPRFGSHRINNEADDWVIEAKASDDPKVDPFDRRDEEKREKLNKQKKNELRNRVRGEKEDLKQLPGVMSINNNVPRPDKGDIKTAIEVARTATASVGKFQATLPGEKIKTKPKKIDYGKEKETTMSVLDKVLGRSEKSNPIHMTKAINKTHIEEKEKRGKNKREAPPRKGSFGGGGGRGGRGGGGGRGRGGGGGGGRGGKRQKR